MMSFMYPEAAGLKHGWNDSFWEGAGLGDLVADGYRRIGVDIVAPGTSVGKGLTEKSAEEMGLRPGIAVATSLIDAHCGGVGGVNNMLQCGRPLSLNIPPIFISLQLRILPYFCMY
jgi:ribulose kinase